jgi:hypothetical protein
MITSSNWNVTQTSMVTNSIPLGSTIAILILILGVIAFVFVGWYAGSTLQRYKRLWAIAKRIGEAVVCAIVGLFVIGVVWVAYIFLDALFTSIGGFDPMWIAYAIGGFAVCAIVGWVAITLAERVAKQMNDAKAETPSEQVNP